ncbi:MAG: SDR family oxidoreductase [Alphaproteobacteria bacterium]|nr:SDR family oxidoreductase [Alphaproteobacteria bacterium]
MSKVILVTGGSRGIGRSAARLCGARGWSVGVNYAGNAKAAAETVAEVEKAGGKAIAIKGDVAVEKDVIAMFDATENAFGPIYGLVNNAGIIAPSMQLADMTVERMQRLFAVNILGSYMAAREAARRMSRSRGGKGGVIVNMSSAAARLGSPNDFVDYAGSKGCIDTFTVGLSKELGPEGIRVNAIRPGLIDTEIHAVAGSPDRAAKLGKQMPLQRAGTANEVGEAVVWLLDDASSYVSGSILDVAGGR